MANHWAEDLNMISFYFLASSSAFERFLLLFFLVANLSSDTGQNKTLAWSSTIFVPLWKVFSQPEHGLQLATSYYS